MRTRQEIMPRRYYRNAMIVSSDNPTLDLDFTNMGDELDSRFTFSRAGNATYINSSGYVAWNNSNLFLNTAWTSATLPTGWQLVTVSPIGIIDYNEDGTIDFLVTGSTQRVFLSPSSAIATTVGMPYTVSFMLVTRGGADIPINQIITLNTGGTETYKSDGVTVASTYAVSQNSVISCTAIATAATTSPRIGLGVLSSFGSVFSVTITQPQMNIGTTSQVYIPNTSTSTPYQAARFDYDPTTLAPKGLLIGGAATNLQRYSATFETTGTYWYQTLGTNVAGTAATAPDNTSTPRRLTEPASGTSTGQLQISGASAGIAASTTYTVSFWAKAGSRTKVLWKCDGGGNDVGFNLSNGVATVVAGTFTTTRMTAYPNGWYRCEATWANVNASGFPSIYLATGTGTTYTISYTCNSSYAELWGFQLETGNGASSYIPTTTAQVTRATDVCTMSGTNFTSWFNNTEGTVLFIGNNTIVPSPSNFSANWALINAASSSRITQYTRHTTGRIGASCRDSGGGALTFDSPSATTLITTTTEYKTAFALKNSDFAYSVNGAAVGLGDGVGVFETVASLDFARDGIRNGHIKCFKFWPTRLTNAQLIAIST